jgi:glycosyltransferase involved in cell wall biosynthesis
VIQNLEVIVCDDHSEDGAWDTANQYCIRHPGKVTVSRNREALGKKANRRKGMQLCKGKYCVELVENAQLDAAYVGTCLTNMEADELLEHAFISRLNHSNVFMPPYNPTRRTSMQDRCVQPLVSICIYNFNYGRYLRQCFDSVFAQTYRNIEVCFSDNASSDDSWQIAMEYAAKYPGKISLTRNRINYGPNVNLWNCLLNMNGKYMLKLCSDDAIQPVFVERCVSSLEKYPDAAFAMVHRDIMDDAGNFSSEPSFYDQSCLIPGNEQAAVYMMSSVNPSISQILYKVEKTQNKRMAGNLNDRWFGDRIMDFHICCDSPIVYIKEPLLLNRIHEQSESAGLNGNLLQCMGEFVLLHQLSDIAANYPNMDKARDRLQPAIEKVANLCLRYCLRSLAAGDETGAQRYFHLSPAIAPSVQDSALHALLSAYWALAPQARKSALTALLRDTGEAIKRTVSYPAPPGSVPC